MPAELLASVITLVLGCVGTGAGLLLKAWLAERRRLEDRMIEERARMEGVWVADRADANAVMRAMLDQCHATITEYRGALDAMRLTLADHTAEDRRAAAERAAAREKERGAIDALARTVGTVAATIEDLSAELLMRPRRDPTARTRREDRG